MFSPALPYLFHTHKGKLLGACLGFVGAGFWGAFFGLLAGLAFDEWDKFLLQLKQRPHPSSPPLAYETTCALALVSLARLTGLPGLHDKKAALAHLSACFALDAQNVRYIGKVLAAPMSPDMLHAASLLSTIRQAADAVPEMRQKVFICLTRLAQDGQGKLSRQAARFLEEVGTKIGIPHSEIEGSLAPLQGAGAADDPYAALGLSPLAAQEEVVAAYKKQIAEVHPDRLRATHSGLALAAAEARATEINTAYGLIRKMRGL